MVDYSKKFSKKEVIQDIPIGATFMLKKVRKKYAYKDDKIYSYYTFELYMKQSGKKQYSFVNMAMYCKANSIDELKRKVFDEIHGCLQLRLEKEIGF